MSTVRQQPRGRRGRQRGAGRPAPRARQRPRAKAPQRRPQRRPERRPRSTEQARLTRAYSGQRLGPVPLGTLVAWQVGIALIYLGFAYKAWAFLVVAFVVAIGIGLLTLLWWNGRPLWRWMQVWKALRVRNRGAAPALPHDPALVPLREWMPELELAAVEGKRGGNEVGVVHDGSGYIVVLGPDREDLISSADPVHVPLAALANVGEAEGVRLASAQLIVQTVPAPVPQLGAYGGNISQSYQEINSTSVPATASWWIALRIDPAQDGTGFTLDGEDSAALRRALRTVVKWATKVLSSSGLPCKALTKAEIREVLALTLGVDPHHRPTSLKARRTAESNRGWTCDGITHVSGYVRTFPKGHLTGMSRLLGAMASLQVRASTASLAVSWAPENVLRWSGFVRVSADNPKTARGAYRQLSKLAGRQRVGLSRLDGEQFPGVIATIPLGGGA